MNSERIVRTSQEPEYGKSETASATPNTRINNQFFYCCVDLVSGSNFSCNILGNQRGTISWGRTSIVVWCSSSIKTSIFNIAILAFRIKVISFTC